MIVKNRFVDVLLIIIIVVSVIIAVSATIFGVITSSRFMDEINSFCQVSEFPVYPQPTSDGTCMNIGGTRIAITLTPTPSE